MSMDSLIRKDEGVASPSSANVTDIRPAVSPARKVFFVLIMVFGVLLLLEAVLSMGLLLQMRLDGKERFTYSEPTYLSILNVPYRAAAKLGLVNESVLLDSPYEFSRAYEDKGLIYPEPREANELPAKRTEVTLLRRHLGETNWERLRVNLTKNLDGSRWTGACPSTATRKVYIFGDSWIAGDVLNDEHTFSYLLQQKRKDLCVKLFAVGGHGLPTTLLQFREMMDEIKPTDYIIIGYADYLDPRSVVAPSRLREVRDWYQRMMGGEQTYHLSLPKASINDQGAVEISFVEENCRFNENYCAQADPSPEEMNKVSTAIVNEIADKASAKVFLLHFYGDSKNPLRQNLRKSVTVISALSRDFDYAIYDDIMGFDTHPGPWWNYAISQKLLQSLP